VTLATLVARNTNASRMHLTRNGSRCKEKIQYNIYNYVTMICIKRQSHNTPMEAQGERMYSSFSFTTSALDEVVSVTLRPRYIPRERIPNTHCTVGWVGPKAGLDTEVRRKILSPLPGFEPRSPDRPARSQTLYWLSYPAHEMVCYQMFAGNCIIGENTADNYPY
jgi:hypothetical protein